MAAGAEITVNTTGWSAKVSWADSMGERGAAAPTGVVVTWAVDNTAVASIDPSTGVVTPLAEGSVLISATANNADGSQALAPDGTPLEIQSLPLIIGPGAAASGTITIGPS